MNEKGPYSALPTTFSQYFTALISVMMVLWMRYFPSLLLLSCVSTTGLF